MNALKSIWNREILVGKSGTPSETTNLMALRLFLLAGILYLGISDKACRIPTRYSEPARSQDLISLIYLNNKHGYSTQKVSRNIQTPASYLLYCEVANMYESPSVIVFPWSSHQSSQDTSKLTSRLMIAGGI